MAADELDDETGREPNPRLLVIGLRIRAARKAAGMRQEDLAEKIGLSRSSIANIETGRQEISLSNLWMIVDALGITVGEVTATPSMPWLELARRVTASQRDFATLAEERWRALDMISAVQFRGVAEGLEIARNHQLDLAREGYRDDPA